MCRQGVFRGSLKFFHIHEKSGSVLTAAGERLYFKDMNSARARAGARYSRKDKETFTWYAGLAAEYETVGGAKAALDGIDLRRAETRGASALLEIGASGRITERLTAEFAATGMVGKRRGFGGSIEIKWSF